MSPSSLSAGSKDQEPEGHCGPPVTNKWVQTGSLSALAPEDASPLGLPVNTWGLLLS